MVLLRARHSVVEISRICLTLRGRLLNLPLDKHRWWKGLAGCFLAVAVAAGCSTAPVQEAAPEAVVKQRAQARWDAMVSGDLAKAYSYISPASRETISLEVFRNSIRLGFWKTAEVTGVTCETDACDVIVQVAYVHRGSTLRTSARETWIRSEGSWWLVFKPA